MTFIITYYNKKLSWLLPAFFLCVSCTTNQPSNKWFTMQGLNITECGPTVARNALCWQTGYCLDRFYARDYATTPLFWNLNTIEVFIEDKGGSANVVRNEINFITSNIRNGHKAIFYINNSHFVLIGVSYNNENKVVIYDSLLGVYTEKLDDFLKNKVSGHNHLLIKKVIDYAGKVS